MDESRIGRVVGKVTLPGEATKHLLKSRILCAIVAEVVVAAVALAQVLAERPDLSLDPMQKAAEAAGLCMNLSHFEPAFL